MLNANESGAIILPTRSDTIYLLSQLSAERMSTFIVDNKNYNIYTFGFDHGALMCFLRTLNLSIHQAG